MNIAQFTRNMALLASLTLITACGGGGGGSSGNTAAEGSNFDSGCTGFCATDNPTFLSSTEVGQIIAQAVNEATARDILATIAVTDRVGNVLGLFQMTGAASNFTIRSGLIAGNQGLENVVLPSAYAAIAKAVTGAYLSSEGNAFSTRTASQIIQQHFNPRIFNLPGGPLFGVQFSQLPCSDLVNRNSGAGIGRGPQRSPLGLSADPGGFPIYKNGHPVGGIGVIADGIYGLDLDIGVSGDGDDANYDDEAIATAGQFGFAPPIDRRANRITVAGNSLRYSDDTNLVIQNPLAANDFTAIGGLGSLIDSDTNTNYYIAANGLLNGSTFGLSNSGIQSSAVAAAAASITDPFAGFDAFVLTDAVNVNRYPPTAGVAITNNNELTINDVSQLLQSALGVANQARAQIRRPLDSRARVTISVVDTAGNILGIVRTRDAPLFGTDVSLQKARTATFFSSPATLAGNDDAGSILSAEGDVTYVGSGAVNVNFSADYVGSIATGKGIRSFIQDDTALNNGIAFADRSGGNLSRPFYPDGIDGTANGPFSKPFLITAQHSKDQQPTVDTANNQWSPFSNGLQLDLVYNRLVDHLVNGTNATTCVGTTRLANGIQIFPGSVPIYRNGILIGGIGVSGDGIEQDDMISFLGTFRASVALTGNGIGSGAILGNAPTGIRADTIMSGQLAGTGRQLRYVQCPQNPFINNSDENVCDGK